MKGFSAPSGVVEVQLDKVTNRLATAACPQDYYVAFIAGTEPKETCEQAFTDHRGFFSKILGLGSPEVAPPPPTTNGPVQAQPGTAIAGSGIRRVKLMRQPPADRKRRRASSAGSLEARATTRTRKTTTKPSCRKREQTAARIGLICGELGVGGRGMSPRQVSRRFLFEGGSRPSLCTLS